MNKIMKGEFFGSHYQKLNCEEFTITDTEYTHDKVDWHYHENPYFTYLLQGKLYEANKKEEYYLKPGSLLFHNWQDSHHNIKPPEYTRGFHIELNAEWFAKNDVSSTEFEGSIRLENPLIKGLMNRIFMETKIDDNFSQLSIELLLMDVFNKMKSPMPNISSKTPSWVKQLQERILESEIDYSLSELSQELNIHPVHLSREFHRYFSTTLGRYVRQLKLNKAVLLIATKRYSMTEICYRCGYYDQSHFISNFKAMYNITPSEFSKQIALR